MSLPSLFAGKMHALLCRTTKTNIKGRDWYYLMLSSNRFWCSIWNLGKYTFD
ncbi:nucleotidyl transferase AbiEii/AbiGii toxin family protein [Desulfobacula sp.]|uniref:nucleotidyl transferase AbiEii/AbiGii toxin family protein n=1 Tax=Desulfobacula sp. TaxID=2593537 RepID=UPI0039B91835